MKLDQPSSFGAFLIRVRGMYLLAKPKMKIMFYVLSILFSLKGGGGLEIFLSTRACIRGKAQNFFEPQGLYSYIGRKLYTTKS